MQIQRKREREGERETNISKTFFEAITRQVGISTEIKHSGQNISINKSITHAPPLPPTKNYYFRFNSASVCICLVNKSNNEKTRASDHQIIKS